MAVQYIRINNPRFLELDNNGRPAAGYLVGTYEAGTVPSDATKVTTYTDRTLTSANTNPIVLDARGQGHIFTNVAVQLVYYAPGGSPDSPIWTEDYASEQQNTIVDNCAITHIGNNKYTGSTSPLFAAIPERLSLVVTPNADSLDTLGTSTFTGTGIDDAVWYGPYVGDSAGSIFSLQILAAFIRQPNAVTAVENVAAGLVTTGNHYVKITAITAGGETTPSVASGVVAVGGADNRKIDVSGIPALAGAVTGYKVYMTAAGGTTYYYVATVVATTYTISIADATLITQAQAPSANTTGDGVDADLVRWRKDSGSWTSVGITTEIQSTINGISFKFPVKTGHTENDLWTQQVMTPVRFDFCGLSPTWLVYKNENGTLKALGAGDFKANTSTTLIASASQEYWLLAIPKLPVLTALQPSFVIKEITSNYAVTSGDARTFLNCSNSAVLTLDSCAAMVGVDFWVASQDESAITVNASGATDKIYVPFESTGQTSLVVPTGNWDRVRFASNGAYWEVIEAIPRLHGTAVFTSTGSWTCPPGITTVYVSGCAQGGGGAGAAGGSGTGAGAGGENGQFTIKQALTVVPGTAYTVTISSAGGGGTGYANGAAGGDVSFGALLTLTGGAGGDKDGGLQYLLTADTLAFATDGKGGTFGGGGEGAKIGTATGGGTSKRNGTAATGYGAGGGGGAAIGGGQSANGGAGSAGILWLDY